MEPGSLPQTQVPRLFTLLDTNGDGVISQKEFLQAMEPERNTRVLTPQRPPGPAPRRAWGWGQTPQEPVTSKARMCQIPRRAGLRSGRSLSCGRGQLHSWAGAMAGRAMREAQLSVRLGGADCLMD
ncbi:unnamed protein product [Effrenium voratum]|nr:unnamed protein product [Effrenium voratum]